MHVMRGNDGFQALGHHTAVGVRHDIRRDVIRFLVLLENVLFPKGCGDVLPPTNTTSP